MTLAFDAPIRYQEIFSTFKCMVLQLPSSFCPMITDGKYDIQIQVVGGYWDNVSSFNQLPGRGDQ